VDDDALVLTLLGKILSNAGFAVATAESYEQALAHLRQRRFDIVLSDLVMPRHSGVEVIAAARKASPEALIVCMTGQGDIAMVGAAQDAGAEECLIKPFTPQWVVTHLSNLVTRKRQRSPQMPQELAALAASRVCPKCRRAEWRVSRNWSEWSAPMECATCGEVVFSAGRCRQCGQWGITGETYSEAFGMCQRCASESLL